MTLEDGFEALPGNLLLGGTVVAEEVEDEQKEDDTVDDVEYARAYGLATLGLLGLLRTLVVLLFWHGSVLFGGGDEFLAVGPEFVEAEEGAFVALENVDDYVEVVHENPFGIVVAFDFVGVEACGFLDGLEDGVAEGADM